MESEETGNYEVIVTVPAEHWFYELVEYLYDSHPLARAEEIADELYAAALSLSEYPERGRREEQLADLSYDYRYIIYKRTQRSVIRIVYYVDKAGRKVYITDFFPDEKDSRRIRDRHFHSSE